jgi:hypothetical protein
VRAGRLHVRATAARTEERKDVTCESAAEVPASITTAATRYQMRGPKRLEQKMRQQPPLTARRVLRRQQHAKE